jgi:hypothetical protein
MIRRVAFVVVAAATGVWAAAAPAGACAQLLQWKYCL